MRRLATSAKSKMDSPIDLCASQLTGKDEIFSKQLNWPPLSCAEHSRACGVF